MTRMGWGRRALGALVAVSLLLVVAGSAQGAILNRQGDGRILWSSSDNSQGHLVDITRTHEFFTGTHTGYSIRIDNEATTVDAASGCTPTGAQPANTFIQCPTNIAGIWLDMFHGSDTIRNNFCPSGIFCLGQSSVDIPVEVWGYGGNDVIETGSGADKVIGSAGDDTITTNGGNDRLDSDNGSGSPQEGSDDLRAGSDDDVITGGVGNDIVSGGDGADSITAGPGDDLLTPGLGDDGVIDGAEGDDTLSFADGRVNGVVVTVSPTEASPAQEDGGVDDNADPAQREAILNVENLVGTPGADTFDTTATGAALNKLEGLGGGDTLLAGDGGDTLLGGEGDDRAQGGLGDDTVDGAGGVDMLDYAERSAGQPVNASLDGVENDGGAAEQDKLGTSFEGITGGAGADTLSASIAGAELHGGGGRDNLFGPAGGGRLFGEEGNDELMGGDGADQLHGGANNDTIDGLAASDLVRGNSGTDEIEARDGFADDVDCGPDEDTAFTDPIDTRIECDPPLPALGTPSPSTAKPDRLRPRVAFNAAATAKSTRFKRLRVLAIPAGSTVAATCRISKRKACPGTGSFRKAGAPAQLRLKSFEGKNLPVGAKIEIRVTKPAAIGALITLVMRKAKNPKVGNRCLSPGSATPARC
jgi:Ca2+-binding RTX toxin-like protein